jgi:ribosomal protein L37AE/L43A
MNSNRIKRDGGRSPSGGRDEKPTCPSCGNNEAVWHVVDGWICNKCGIKCEDKEIYD